MLRPRRRLALCALVLLAATARAAEPVRIEGTHVRLHVPEGFRVAAEFPGLGLDEDLTSVLVSELPVPLAVSRRDLDEDALAHGGVILRRAAEVEVGRFSGVLVHATQRIAGIEFRKWLLLFGDETGSVLLTATTPLDLEERYQKALVETLSTAIWDPDLAATPPEGLRFRVREVAPLRIVRSSANAIVLADPARTGGDTLTPLVTVGSSLVPVQIGDLPRFARRRLEESTSIEQIEVESERPRELGGLPGHEIVATARDVATRRPVRVTQLLASDGERYYLVQGIADAEDAASFAAPLEQVIGSFALVE